MTSWSKHRRKKGCGKELGPRSASGRWRREGRCGRKGGREVITEGLSVRTENILCFPQSKFINRKDQPQNDKK